VKVRAFSRSALAWAFGLSVSILFVSIWGRAVVVDTDTLAESLAPLAESTIVREYVGEWMVDELVDSGADPSTIEPTMGPLFEGSSVSEALDQLIGEMVEAAAATDPAGSRIDMAGLFRPTVPELTLGLRGMGYPTAESEVSGVVEGLDPLVIRQPGGEPLVGPYSPTAARLGTAALLAFICIVGFGFGVVAMSEDRVAEVRRLLNRIAVGGLSFAVFLRLGSWVLDPAGGRAPVRSTLSAVAGSKWLIPLQVALVAGAVAGAIYFGRRWLRRQGGFRSVAERSIRRREQSRSRSGSD
jgi:hypothetical protein